MILICGIPNAGKTTYSNRFDNVIHYDDVNSTENEPLIITLLKLINACPENVCVEGLFLKAFYRKELVSNVNKKKKICIWLDTPLEECFKRELRERSLVLIREACTFFDPPTFDEGWDEIIIIRGDKEEHLINPQKNLTSS